MSADHITCDLARKATEDVMAAARRTLALAEDDEQRAKIAIMIGGAWLSFSGALCVKAVGVNPDRVRELTRHAETLAKRTFK